MVSLKNLWQLCAVLQLYLVLGFGFSALFYPLLTPFGVPRVCQVNLFLLCRIQPGGYRGRVAEAAVTNRPFQKNVL